MVRRWKVGTNHSPYKPRNNITARCQTGMAASSPRKKTLGRFRSICSGSILPIRYVGMMVATMVGIIRADV